MPSERVQRRIDRLLDQAEEAADRDNWVDVSRFAEMVLEADPDNGDAGSFLNMVRKAGVVDQGNSSPTQPDSDAKRQDPEYTPTSFDSGRYIVSKFLGEGGKKKVYLAHDNTLDRDVAFALIKTEGLDETSRERVRREAQAMGRMGTHPSIMPIYDLGEENGQPFIVQPLMGGGDVEGLIEDAEGPLELERAITIATQTAEGLSFAHGKGIVHRDLKPGNVWLDEDGAAKIGDFGLAVATDRSRLTVEKVIVGTVSYMPPEQATGGEVTPRADLYSLGAMLYEMCTGRVPFMGDDDIGIISQHINTPPVAPSWHNARIPKTLDSLILRLMAKDPSERPDSADEVLAALNAVDLAAVEEREEESKGSLDSMAGGVFVGRHREMDQLKSIFEDVLSGKGRMVTLVGEPGIGKTRTAQELATYAGMRGAQVLWGRSYESGGAPPYWPWVQAIRTHVAATEPQALRDQLGSTAPVIAEVVPDVKAKLPDLPAPTPIEDPESARFRLFDSISTFLKNTASATPLVLMLEDLHWSDKPSLMLLEFVARELANSRILIVGNYRDMELNRRHPLSVTLGDLSRERLFERIVLRGLQKHDVQRFIEIAAGIAPASALVDTVHTQTEGNPLFVTETVRLLIQEGDIASGQSSKGGTTSWDIRIPEGVREVIGRRLDRLSERTNEVLTIAAVIGRQFRFPLLKILMEDTTDGQLLDALDDALSARIIEELPTEVGLYQFTHAQMQETLTEELSANRRVRMHARIAEALEQHYGDQAEEHAAELVVHFAEAETVLGTDKVATYSKIVGLQMISTGNFSEAISHLESAKAYMPADDIDQADILIGLAKAHGALLNPGKAAEVASLAYELLMEKGLAETAFDVIGYPYAVNVFRAMPETVIDAYCATVPGTPSHAKISIPWGFIQCSTGNYQEGLTALEGTAEYARGNADKLTELRTLAMIANVTGFAGEYKKSLDSARAALRLIEVVDDYPSEMRARLWLSHALETIGNSQDALAASEEMLVRARKLRDETWIVRALQPASRQSISVGDWPRAKELLAESRILYPEGFFADYVELLCALLIGEHELTERLIRQLSVRDDSSSTRDSFSLHAYSAIILAIRESGFGLDLIPEVKSRLRKTMAETSYPPLTTFTLWADVEDSEDEIAIRTAVENLNNVRSFDFGIDSTSTHIAKLYRRLGDKEMCLKNFAHGVDHSRRMNAPIPLGRGLADYSEMLLDRNAPGDREKAIELQDEAIAIATELGMNPLLERVLAKREILKA